jgi:hypothetical protein
MIAHALHLRLALPSLALTLELQRARIGQAREHLVEFMHGSLACCQANRIATSGPS